MPPLRRFAGNRAAHRVVAPYRGAKTTTAAGAHPRVASLGLRPIHLQPPPYRWHGPRRTGGPMWPPLRLKGTALITRTVFLIRHGFAVPPYPFCPFGTFPPDRGNRPSPRGRQGDSPSKPSPLGEGAPRRGRMRYPVYLNRVCWFGKPRRKSGTAAASIFAHSGPSGPEETAPKHSWFCAPEGFCPLQGVTPVMGVRG